MSNQFITNREKLFSDTFLCRKSKYLRINAENNYSIWKIFIGLGNHLTQKLYLCNKNITK